MADYGELSQLERNRNPGGNAGAMSIGAMLAGGGRSTQNAYNEGAMTGAKMADVLAQARQRQRQNVATESLAHQLELKGDNEGAAAVRASTTFNYDTYNKGKIDSYKASIMARMQAEEEKDNPDPEKLNRLRGDLEGKSVNLTDIKDNTRYNPTILPTSQGAGQASTSIGEAMTAKDQAERAAALARAGESNAQAARAKAGIGVDKAANHEVLHTDDGDVDYDKLTHTAIPIKMGDKAVRQPTKEGPESKLPEPMLLSLLGGSKNPTTGQNEIDPQSASRFIAKKQELGSKASDTDVIMALRKDDEAAQTTGPPADLAPQSGSIMESLGFHAPAGPSAMPTAPPAAPPAAAPTMPTMAPSAPHPDDPVAAKLQAMGAPPDVAAKASAAAASHIGQNGPTSIPGAMSAPAAPPGAPAVSGAPAAPAGGQFVEGKTYVDGSGKKAIYRNGAFVEI